MTNFTTAALIVLGSAAFIASAAKFVIHLADEELRAALVWALICAAMIFVVLWGALETHARQNAKGPCLEWSTGTAYNPATKLVSTYRRCVERGEWMQ